MDDTQIIDLFFIRSESAIAETARKYGAYLNQVAYHILRCREDTEEIVEDTYLAAWNAIPPTRPQVFKHFLSRITRNLSFDRLDHLTARKRSSHMSVLLSELEECIPDHSTDPEALWEAKETRLVLNRFLESLNKQDCQFFLCRYFYNMALGEIAEKYGLSQRQIKYRLSCMRKALRKLLEKEEIAV